MRERLSGRFRFRVRSATLAAMAGTIILLSIAVGVWVATQVLPDFRFGSPAIQMVLFAIVAFVFLCVATIILIKALADSGWVARMVRQPVDSKARHPAWEGDRDISGRRIATLTTLLIFAGLSLLTWLWRALDLELRSSVFWPAIISAAVGVSVGTTFGSLPLALIRKRGVGAAIRELFHTLSATVGLWISAVLLDGVELDSGPRELQFLHFSRPRYALYPRRPRRTRAVLLVIGRLDYC